VGRRSVGSVQRGEKRYSPAWTLGIYRLCVLLTLPPSDLLFRWVHASRASSGPPWFSPFLHGVGREDGPHADAR